jgi:hypothetical protein
MNQSAQSFKNLPAIILALAVVSNGFGAPATTPPANVPPAKSVFALPTKPSEGRDPFFPDSIRPYEEVVAENNANAPTVTDLVVKTILVNEHGQAFAIINDQTFGVGDEGDVIAVGGRRIHIHCDSIDPSKGVVMVQTGEITMALTYSGNQ